MYKVRIDKFEGPFDLLIYLLENARMDIYDIKVAEITEQYIGYLKEMEERGAEVDTEFIVLAAVLIRLKSRMLLPRMNQAGELEIIEDPRQELAGRLLDYMRTKRAAEMLQAAEEYNLAIHEKPAEDMSAYLENPDEILKASDEQLVNAFILFLTRKKRVEDVSRRYQRVRRRKDTIEARIKDMTDLLEKKFKDGDGKVLFTELLPEEPDRYDITLSFMSLLSMIKNQNYDAEQAENFGEIKVIQREKQTPVESSVGIRIREVDNAFGFVTYVENDIFVKKLCTPVRVRRLSQAALEVLAIIAYRQPVTRSEIDSIRGIKSERVIDGLIAKELVEVTGRSEGVGRPLIYGTTSEFLRKFGFASLKDLPEVPEYEEMRREREEEGYGQMSLDFDAKDADEEVNNED